MNTPLWISFIEIGDTDYLIEEILYNGKKLAWVLTYNSLITKVLLEM